MMPGMNGTELLKYVKQNFPKIIRITLSGYANDNLALMNTRIVHQSLTKPTTPELIKETIESAVSLKNQLSDDKLLSIVNGIEDIPSLPEVYLELEEELTSDNASLNTLSSIINRDPIITAKILQLTNSAFFGLPNRISSTREALNLLGVNIIKNLVLSIKLFKVIERDKIQSKYFEEIWHHSNKVAEFASTIAKINNLSIKNVEDCYLGGLLHDIGKLIIIDNFNKITFNNEDESMESKINNPLHAPIGAYLLGLWGLPDSIVQAVLYHQSLDGNFPEIKDPSSIINFANRIAKQNKYKFEDLSSDNLLEIYKEVTTNM
jgi:putative nucleotidyltransferase with HDIG domain